MAQDKRSNSKASKKPLKKHQQHGNVKQALKKKHLLSTKSRNDDIREKLDRDSHSLHSELRALVDPRPQLQLEPTVTPESVDVSESLTDLTTVLQNL